MGGAPIDSAFSAGLAVAAMCLVIVGLAIVLGGRVGMVTQVEEKPVESKACPRCGKPMVRQSTGETLTSMPPQYPMEWRCECGAWEDAGIDQAPRGAEGR